MKLDPQFYYKKNRLQQLEGFYYTVQLGGISSAAKKLGLTQSAITLRIQTLERDLKVELFTRDKKTIKITDEGKKLYACSTAFIQGIDDLFETFMNLSKSEKMSTINLAANHVSISYILPKYLKKFKDENPEVKFKIRNLDKNEAIKRLLDDEIDFFIYPIRNDEIQDELEFIPIVTYHPIVLVRKDNPLSQKKNITLNDVKKYELVRIDPHLITLPAFEEIIKSHGLKTRIEFEMSDWEILKKFVKAEIGVAIISSIVLEGENDSELIGRNLTNYFPEMTYGMLVKKGKIFNGLLKKFVTMLSQEKLLLAHRNQITS